MPVAWHPTRRWDCVVPKDEKKKNRTKFFCMKLVGNKSSRSGNKLAKLKFNAEKN